MQFLDELGTHIDVNRRRYLLRGAGGLRLWGALRQQLYNPCPLHVQARLAEIPLRFIGPMQTTDYPIRKAIDINSDLSVNLRTPRWEVSTVLDEAVNGLPAQIADKVDRTLQVEALLVHDDDNHVVCVVCVINVVGESSTTLSEIPPTLRLLNIV